MRKQSWIIVGALTLALACALAWWTYRWAQKRELQQEVIALVQDSTARMRETLELLAAGPEARAKLEADFTALEGSVGRIQALNASLHPALVQAADDYVSDAHALLRRQLALRAGRDAVLADVSELNNHLRAAGTRSPEWIRQAIALNRRLEKSFFDYRFAAGGLEKSLRSLRDARPWLLTLVPADAVVDEQSVSAAEKRLLDLSTQIERQVENVRKLPAG